MLNLPNMTEALFQDYRPSGESYDELLAPDGSIRPAYRFLIDSLEKMGSALLQARVEELNRQLRENGVTYNIYSDAGGSERLWPLDPLPVLITSSEWQQLELALIQRAELLDLILTDIYTERTLIKEGFIPPEVIYAHSGFLRPAVGTVKKTGRRSLPIYAADIARDPKGNFILLADRTQAPSGAGYALENRITLSRVFPSLFRDSHVHRIAGFFRALRQMLGGDGAQSVILTPGPGNETYFEHAYLASYLGYPLAQGGDLTVRRGRVMLKTIEGLRPVDSILRRIDDAYCDPLELRADSLLGTPGLLQAVRQNSVWIASPIGTGVLENPALAPYLPRISRHLLGEDLLLPAAPTWWCGDKTSLSHVLANLPQLVIKPIARSQTQPTIYCRLLDSVQLAELSRRIRQQPHLFVAQEYIPLSTQPLWQNGRFAARRTVLRSFLTAAGNSYVVFPGGLARVAAHAEDLVVNNQRGAVSKDVWISASEPERQLSLLPQAGDSVKISRSSGEIPSRVADNMFWLARYAERTDIMARLLREVLYRVMENGAGRYDRGLPQLLRCVTYVTETRPGFFDEENPDLLQQPERELLRIIYNPQVVGSIAFNVNALVYAGRSVRDRLSADMRRVLNSLQQRPQEHHDLEDVFDYLQRLISAIAAFSGLSHESMTRGQGWRFLEIGRRIERAQQIGRLIGYLVTDRDFQQYPVWDIMLAIHDSQLTYRRRYRSRIEPGAVLDLLLCDESNPRSLGFQLSQLLAQVVELPAGKGNYRIEEEKLVLEAATLIRLQSFEAFQGTPEAISTLYSLLEKTGELLSKTSDVLAARYFSYIEVQKQLSFVEREAEK